MTTSSATFRIVFDIFLLVSILFLSWWVTVILVLFGVFIFSNYIEIIIAGMLVDILYGEHNSFVSFLGVYGTVSTISVYFLVKVLKSKLR